MCVQPACLPGQLAGVPVVRLPAPGPASSHAHAHLQDCVGLGPCPEALVRGAHHRPRVPPHLLATWWGQQGLTCWGLTANVVRKFTPCLQAHVYSAAAGPGARVPSAATATAQQCSLQGNFQLQRWTCDRKDGLPIAEMGAPPGTSAAPPLRQPVEPRTGKSRCSLPCRWGSLPHRLGTEQGRGGKAACMGTDGGMHFMQPSCTTCCRLPVCTPAHPTQPHARSHLLCALLVLLDIVKRQPALPKVRPDGRAGRQCGIKRLD